MTSSRKRTAVAVSASSRASSRLASRRERLVDEAREIDRAQQARAMRRQRLLAARVGGADLLAVGEVVRGVDAVDEDDARLGVVVGGAHDAVPERARRHRAVDLAVEDEVPRLVVAHGANEGVRHQHRQVEVAQAGRIGLGVDEGLDVGMVAAQRRHHGAAPRARRHDGAAHGVPHVHEADGARGVRADALHQRALGAQGGEVVADAAALLHGERGFLDVVEDGAEVVLDAAHHEAVEERDGAARAGAGKDAAGRQEGEVGHRLGEAASPSAPLARFGSAAAAALRHPRPGVGDACGRRARRPPP